MTNRFEPLDEGRAGLALADVVEREIEQVLVLELAEQTLEPGPRSRPEPRRDDVLPGRKRSGQPGGPE